MAAPRAPVEPPPDVVESGPRRRRSRWLVVVGALVVLLGVARLTTSSHPSSDNSNPPPGPSTAPLPVTLPQDVGVRSGGVQPMRAFSGLPSALALANGILYAAQVDPPRLVRLTSAGKRAAQDRSPRDPSGIAVEDYERGPVWVWSSHATSTDVAAFDPLSLRRLATTRIHYYVMSGTALGGSLWLGTPEGLLRMSVGDLTPAHVPAVRGQVFSLAADAPRARVVGVAGQTLFAIHASDGGLVATRRLPFGQASVAPVGDDLYVSGFGRESASSPLLLHLHASDLRPAARVPMARNLSPGAIVWPGADVVWVRDGGSTALTCLDARTGRALQSWADVQGPVVSGPGVAYALTGADAARLVDRGGCTG